MKNTIIIIAIILVVGFGIYFVVANNNNSSTTPINNSQTTPPDITSINSPTTNNNQVISSSQATTSSVKLPISTVSKPANVSVSIKNFAFSPTILNIKTGTKVTWTNNDSVSHTITSDSGLFDSGNLSSGQSFSFTFSNAGTINYHCAIHPMMKGSVVVGN